MQGFVDAFQMLGRCAGILIGLAAGISSPCGVSGTYQLSFPNIDLDDCIGLLSTVVVC
jgi:hypothetical protein